MRPHDDAPPLSSEPIHRVRESFADFHDVDAFTPALSDRLFERAPTVHPLCGDNLAEQHRTLARMLGLPVAPDGLQDKLARLGQRHAGYDAREPHCPEVGTALTKTLAMQPGPCFGEDAHAAWITLFLRVSPFMQPGFATA